MRGAALLVLLAACDGADAPEPVGDTDPLRDPAYRFCHREGADGAEVERWCALLADAPPDVCPGMRATCEKEAFAAPGGGCDGGGFGGGIGDAPSRPEPELEPLGCEPPEPSQPGGLEAVLRWAAALVAAAVVVVVASAVARRTGWWRRRVVRAAAPADVELIGLEGDDDLPALPEDALLAEARRALADGRLADAAIWARGAALRRLARQGRLVLHRARTDREYLRAVRRDEGVADALATVLRAVEEARWAGRTLTVELAAAAVEAAGRLLAAAVLALLLWPSEALAGRHGPDGDAALRALVEAAGWEVVPTRGDLRRALKGADVLVIDLTVVVPSPEEWHAIESFASSTGLVVLGGGSDEHFTELGAWRGAPPGEVVAGPALPGPAPALPRWPDGPGYRWCDGEGSVLVALRPRAPEGGEPAPAVDTDVDGDAADTDAAVTPTPDACEASAVVRLAAHGTGRVLGIADPAVLRNAAMVVPANRAFLTQVLRRLAALDELDLPPRPKVVLATWGATRSDPDPWRSVANAKLLPFVLQLLLLWALLALSVGWPLSPLRDPPEAGRRDFGEHAVALGHHWRRVRATRHAAAAFARLELQRLGPQGLAVVAARGGLEADAVRAFVHRVEALAADPDGPPGPDDVTTVEELWKLTRARST